jgi:hypothetical protein
LDQLHQDFSNFKVGDPTRASIVLEISADKVSSSTPLFAFKTSQARVFGWASNRKIIYSENDIVISHDNRLRSILVISPDRERLYELAYLSLLSSLGEALEKLNFIRIHSLSLKYQNQGFVFHFASGLGKSTLAYLISQKENYNLLGDEITLFKNNTLYSFPLRFALSQKSAELLGLKWDDGPLLRRKEYEPKLLIPIPAKSLSPSASLRGYVFGIKSPDDRAVILKSVSALVRLKFLFDLTIGRNLPQILELGLRRKTLAFLPIMLIKRLWLGIKLLTLKKVSIFYVSSDPDMNMTVLTQYIDQMMREKS